MISYAKIPFVNPFKFTKYGSKGIHFDDQWTRNQILPFERPVYYKQPWNRAYKTKIQMESTIMPQPIQYWNGDGQLVGVSVWTNVMQAVNYAIYEVEIDFTGLPQHTYFLYQLVVNGGIRFEYISEPIDVRDQWQKTVLMYEYNHHFNDYGVAWTTGIEMRFFVESAIMEPVFGGDRTAYVNQTADTKTLNAVPTRGYKLYIGGAHGVSPWVLDLMNRIFKCSRTVIQGMRYSAAPDQNKIDTTYFKGNHQVGGAIDIVPAFNNDSLELSSDGSPLTGINIVTAYNINTAFFGPGAIVPVTDIEKQD